MITLPDDIATTEHLLVWFMGHFSRIFKGSAILKGGMVLRLMECPRSTNDLDILFVPFKSKKEVFPAFKKAITQIRDIDCSFHMDSKCFRCIVRYRQLTVQVEGTVATSCESEAMSTAPLVRGTTLQPALVAVQKREIALAHKLATWNERQLMRDLYDIYFFVSVLDVLPEKNVLAQRLQNVFQGRVNKSTEMTMEAFCQKLDACRQNLSQDQLQAELRPIVNEMELPGLAPRIKTALHRVLRDLRALDS